MPRLVRLYIKHVLIGFALSGVFVALLLWQNVGNLRHLLLDLDMGWVALFMLFMFNGLVFAGVQFAIVIMRMGQEDEPPAGGKRLRLPAQARPAPVPAVERRDRHGRQGY